MNKSEGLTLRELREQNKNTAAEVAAVLGISERALYYYENGKRRISLEQVLTLAMLYNETVEEIIKAQLNSCQNVR